MLARYLFCLCLTVLFLNRDYCSGNKCISNTTRIFLDNFVLSVNGSDRLSLDSLQELFLTKSISNNTTNTTSSCRGISDEDERNACLLQYVSLLKIFLYTLHDCLLKKIKVIMLFGCSTENLLTKETTR